MMMTQEHRNDARVSTLDDDDTGVNGPEVVRLQVTIFAFSNCHAPFPYPFIIET